MSRAILACIAVSALLVFTTGGIAAAEDTGLEVKFVDKQGSRVDERQLGSWIEIQNLSTHESLSQRVLSNVLLIPKLSPGPCKLSVQHKQTRFSKCGVRRQSWKLLIRPGEMNRFTLTVHFKGGAGCPAD
jgi:hypothetical protein